MITTVKQLIAALENFDPDLTMTPGFDESGYEPFGCM